MKSNSYVLIRSFMKRVNLIWTIILFCLIQAEAKKIPGYIISKSLDTGKKDTTYVTFNIPVSRLTGDVVYFEIQNMVIYYDSLGREVKLRPMGVKEISFVHNEEKIRMLSRENHLGVIGGDFLTNTSVFLKLVITGKVRLFKYYDVKIVNRSSGGYYDGVSYIGGGTYQTAKVIEKYVMQKSGGVITKIGKDSFRMDMLLLNDCETIMQKIDDGSYRYSEVEMVIYEYNRICK